MSLVSLAFRRSPTNKCTYSGNGVGLSFTFHCTYITYLDRRYTLRNKSFTATGKLLAASATICMQNSCEAYCHKHVLVKIGASSHSSTPHTRLISHPTFIPPLKPPLLVSVPASNQKQSAKALDGPDPLCLIRSSFATSLIHDSPIVEDRHRKKKTTTTGPVSSFCDSMAHPGRRVVCPGRRSIRL